MITIILPWMIWVIFEQTKDKIKNNDEMSEKKYIRPFVFASFVIFFTTKSSKLSNNHLW